ncbi:MAG: hypothetical protein HKN31_03260, partial [Pricia sp.]|nr:hypothetical protein [Pricia sp.]
MNRCERHFFKNMMLLLMASVMMMACDKPEKIELKSPDSKKKVSFLTDNDQIGFSITYDGSEVLQPSILEIISEELPFVGNPSVLKVEHTSESNMWNSDFLERSTIDDNYNQMKVYLEHGGNKINIICRAYDEGIAFAYEIPEQRQITEIGLDERIHYNFVKDYEVWSTPKRGRGVLTAQGKYKKIPISQLVEG